MINKLDLINKIDEELRLDANTLITRLPLIPKKFEIINGRKIPIYDKAKVIHSLKMRRSREGSTAHLVKLQMIERLK